jgi:hypothetical protein
VGNLRRKRTIQRKKAIFLVHFFQLDRKRTGQADLPIFSFFAVEEVDPTLSEEEAPSIVRIAVGVVVKEGGVGDAMSDFGGEGVRCGLEAVVEVGGVGVFVREVLLEEVVVGRDVLVVT